MMSLHLQANTTNIYKLRILSHSDCHLHQTVYLLRLRALLKSASDLLLSPPVVVTILLSPPTFCCLPEVTERHVTTNVLLPIVFILLNPLFALLCLYLCHQSIDGDYKVHMAIAWRLDREGKESCKF